MENNNKENILDLSISTVNWNVTDKLQKCIDSVLNSYENLNYEWFIIDNVSKDADFLEVTKKYSKYERLIFIQNDKNEGLAAQNKIIDKIKGRYLLLLGPDTLQKGKPIETLIKFMDSVPESGMVHARQLAPDGKDFLSHYNTPYSFSKFFFTDTRIGTLIDRVLFSNKMSKVYIERVLKLNPNKLIDFVQVPVACLLARTELVLEDGYIIDPELSFYFNDVDLCQRIWNKGYKIFVVPDAKIIHDHSSSYKQVNKIWAALEMQKCQIKFFRKYYNKYIVLILKCIMLMEILISTLENKLYGRFNKKKLCLLFQIVLKA